MAYFLIQQLENSNWPSPTIKNTFTGVRWTPVKGQKVTGLTSVNPSGAIHDFTAGPGPTATALLTFPESGIEGVDYDISTGPVLTTDPINADSPSSPDTRSASLRLNGG